MNTQTQGSTGTEQQKSNSGLGHVGTSGEQEGTIAKAIEQHTAKLPSDAFLWAAIGGMGLYKDKSRFFGQWVAPFLLFGVYNKLVKQHGSDKTQNSGTPESIH
jgi:hypothetical protein